MFHEDLIKQAREDFLSRHKNKRNVTNCPICGLPISYEYRNKHYSDSGSFINKVNEWVCGVCLYEMENRVFQTNNFQVSKFNKNITISFQEDIPPMNIFCYNVYRKGIEKIGAMVIGV